MKITSPDFGSILGGLASAILKRTIRVPSSRFGLPRESNDPNALVFPVTGAIHNGEASVGLVFYFDAGSNPRICRIDDAADQQPCRPFAHHGGGVGEILRVKLPGEMTLVNEALLNL